jgi:hypothetical protein
MGQNTTTQTWGSFLRILGIAPDLDIEDEETVNYAPNIQLNYVH